MSNPTLTRYHTPGGQEHDQDTHGNWADGGDIFESPEKIAEQTWYRGHKEGQLLGQTETFVALTRKQSEQFAGQVGGVVSEVKFKRPPKVYPSRIPWDEYQRHWRNSALLAGYDVVPIIEPNGQNTSLAVRNPDILWKT